MNFWCRLVFIIAFISQPLFALSFTGGLSLFYSKIAAIKSTTILVKQAIQMAKDVEYFKQQTESLVDFDWSSLVGITEHLNEMSDFMRKTSRISEKYDKMASKFERKYGRKAGDFSKKADEWEAESWEATRNVFENSGTLAKGAPARRKEIKELVRQTRKVKGNKQALQVIAATLSVQTKQLEELKSILIADSQAKQSVVMSDKVNREKIRKSNKDFLRGFTDPPRPKYRLTQFPKLGETVI